MEQTLFSFDIKLVLKGLCQDCLNLDNVAVKIWEIDKNIINIGNDEFSQHVSQYIIYKILESPYGMAVYL